MWDRFTRIFSKYVSIRRDTCSSFRFKLILIIIPSPAHFCITLVSTDLIFGPFGSPCSGIKDWPELIKR